jgi:guanyl-specific ribonuclease Sa
VKTGQTTLKFKYSDHALALVLGTVFAFALFCGVEPLMAKAPPEATPIAVAQLPAEAQATLELIARGGPFRYSRDGVVFGNREKLLPLHARGYYHEYTVPTPGSKTRGARRIICGGAKFSVTECYYSDDHYQSFRRIVQ